LLSTSIAVSVVLTSSTRSMIVEIPPALELVGTYADVMQICCHAIELASEQVLVYIRLINNKYIIHLELGIGHEE
jgi:hypothetical protein